MIKIHRACSRYITFRTWKNNFYIFEFDREHSGKRIRFWKRPWIFIGHLPEKPWAYRIRFGPFIFERIRRVPYVG